MFSTNANHSIVTENYENASNVNLLFAERNIEAGDFGTTDINTYGGIPSESFTSVKTSKIIMNLNVDNSSTSQGYPELYYDSGRFTAEFSLIEKL